MIRQPKIYTPSEIRKWDTSTQLPDGRWVPARPMGGNTQQWITRFKMALKVLIGKFDVLDWEE